MNQERIDSMPTLAEVESRLLTPEEIEEVEAMAEKEFMDMIALQLREKSECSRK